jgi:hypothetical protein
MSIGRPGSSPARRSAIHVLAFSILLSLPRAELRGAGQFQRGDSNGDSQVDISDPITTLGYLFLGSAAPACLDAADANDDAALDLSDAIYTFDYLYTGGPVPPDPGPDAPGPDPTPDALGCSTGIVCGEGASGSLSPGGRIEVPPGVSKDLAGAAVAAGVKTTVPSTPVTIACAADIAPAGYVALGPAVRFGPEGAASDRPFSITLPYRASLLPAGGGRRHVRIVARRAAGAGAVPFFTPVSDLTLLDSDPAESRATFNAAELTTYQVVAPADAGKARTRHFTYRSISGISMGGGAALAIGLRNSHRFDSIGDLGGMPGADWVYALAMINEFHRGGFCTTADQTAGRGDIGQSCPGGVRAPLADQFEIGGDFEHLPYQAGEGVGLTLRRSFYVRLWRDQARALGNPWLFNASHPYLPPGVPETWLAAADRCENPVVLSNFFDREYNPDGALAVITFCDGGDSIAAGFGVFDPAAAQTNPVEVLLAVDVNGNGRRDQGEPVIVQASEPWKDTGVDGVADIDEPGYDAVTNPDPNGDDYHYWRNPRGTENDLRHEEGEPFEDVGIDGVAGTPQQPEGYDFGEGDGKWTLNPNVERWYASDAAASLLAMGAARRERLGIWLDAGIHDFLNAHVAANRLAGAMELMEMPLAVFDGFATLSHAADEASYDLGQVDWNEWPASVYLRYGDPDATEAQVGSSGDGRHVGSARQSVDRIRSLFAWTSARWPGGDRSIPPQTEGTFLAGQVFTSAKSGRVTPYAVFLPPGYSESPGLTYPVVYYLHGYGMDPDAQAQLATLLSASMVDPGTPEEKRLQKMIIVFADGRCRPGSSEVPVPADGDGCEEGTFFMDSPSSETAQLESALFELMDEIDHQYRVKPAEDLEVVP